MKLAQFTKANSHEARLGAAVNDQLIDLGHSSMTEIICAGTEAVEELKLRVANAQPNDRLKIDDIEFLPAVYPSKIICIGRNYLDHAIEGGQSPPEEPLIFNKLPNALSSHNQPIVLSSLSSAVDYEAELAVIMGKRARRVSEQQALDYVFGYSLINDVSARDLQYGDKQWTRGKSLDSFAPLGPFITTRDEIEDVQALKIEGRLNGQVMQSSNTSKMIFSIARLISYISQGITMEPGDVIATGTPEGVGYFREPKVLLKPGDVFEVIIEELGTLRNPVIAAL